jgi:transcription-repair coupling factor (superfamily II helicase)
MKRFKDLVTSSTPFSLLRESFEKADKERPVILNGVSGSLLAFIAAEAFAETGRQILVIASDNDRAETLRDDCALILGDDQVRLFGSRPAHYSQTLDLSSPIAQIETLKALSSSSARFVVASSQSIVEKIPSPARFQSTMIELRVGGETDFTKLIERLAELGFDKKEFVEGYGDFAVRGGILDVFPYIGENPIRFEFWGNSIESIREFDALSQRSIRALQSAAIVPDPSPQISESGESSADSAAEPDGSLFDYLQNDALLILDDPAIIEREVNELFAEGKQHLFDWEFVEKRLQQYPRFVNSALASAHHANDEGNNLQVIKFDSSPAPAFGGSMSALIDKITQLNHEGYTVFLCSDSQKESSRLQELIEESFTDPQALPAHDSESDEDLLLRDDNPVETITAREENNFSLPAYEMLPESIHSGFAFPPAKLAIFTEHEIFGRLKRRGLAKRRRFKGISQKELQQLRPGDYVVHVDHGIGTFAGLTKISVGGVEQEVMKVLFLENDVLYVNLNFVARVQKYASKEGHVPKLTRLGSQEWEKMKARAKKRIKDIARDLIALYARRKSEQGFAFTPDTHWQKELEASFMYEDTPDQGQATSDVKRDMESDSPMDRLICGDVGFGKTEVAVRAAFTAAHDGKQVAILVPTTILALQHYNTFQDRLKRFAVRVENLTRFKSKKDQKAIVDALASGRVDIIIGTHRLLSADIAFKDIGLLIIDEEHRFGVAAKEKLRRFKATVDTLTLTATPIPRTLHFSLIGARDLSLINTPPRNRLPVSTEIIPADVEGRQTHWRIIREAIIHELHRGGQVYFVHDRVENIDAIASQVHQHVPEARVHIAHGQMEGRELEKTMLDFLEKKYDVLLCTKIIESGLDIPNVNTIIINRADRFGLAELYQLRGRVGRSNVQAYAYLLTPPLSSIPRITLRRLQAIEEFEELGSGFNLAMRDLEIRGTGNLLGAEQSGFIMEMGFEMYERIVRESVDELKMEEFKEIFQPKTEGEAAPAPQSGKLPGSGEIQTIVDAQVDAFIPEFYIESDAERLDVYRRIYRAVDLREVQQIREELRDRFGEYSEEVDNLFLLVEIRLLANKWGFKKVEVGEKSLALTLPDPSHEEFYGKDGDPDSPFQRLMKSIQSGGKAAAGKKSEPQARLKQEQDEVKLLIVLAPADNPTERLKQAVGKLTELNLTVQSPTI